MLSTRVAFVRPEAPKAVTIRLDLRGQAFAYRAGQAVEIDPNQFESLRAQIREYEERKGCPEMPRAFSCASHPLEEGYIEITAKVDDRGPYPPLLTPYLLSKLCEGDDVTIGGPVGKLLLPEDIPAGITGAIHVAAGSGVVPIWGIVRHSIAARPGFRHLVFLQNRTEADIFYRDGWTRLERRHPDLLKVVHVLSQPEPDWTGRRGHLDLGVAGREMEGFVTTGECYAFVVGPNRPGRRPGFMDSFAGVRRKNLKGILGELGIPFERIFTEMW